MHLVYVALLAFLIAEVHYMRGNNAPPPRWIIVQAGVGAPKTPIMFREPFLAAEAEQETRAIPFTDGVKGTGCTEEATGSRFPDSRRPSTKVWKPWAEGS